MRECIFQKGQSKRIWNELYKVDRMLLVGNVVYCSLASSQGSSGVFHVGNMLEMVHDSNGEGSGEMLRVPQGHSMTTYSRHTGLIIIYIK